MWEVVSSIRYCVSSPYETPRISSKYSAVRRIFNSLLGVSSGDETRRLMLYILGSFSNDDGDGNEDVKKAIGLLRKTTTLHVHHAFLYISLPSLHDYDVKMPNCKFYGGRKQATTNLFFSF